MINAVMKPPPITRAILIIQGPDGKNEEVDLGLFVNEFTVNRIAEIFRRYGVRADVERRVDMIEIKY